MSVDPGPPPSSFRRSLDALAQIVASGRWDDGAWRAQPNPDELARLFAALLFDSIRRGPDGSTPPSAIVTAARHAAKRGALPLAALARLRATLAETAAEARHAGAWDPATPLWWEPLPQPGALERHDTEVRLTLPPPASLSKALDSPEPWLTAADMLDPATVGTIWQELETAFQNGGLAMEPGAVGADGARSARRTDWTRYSDGLDPELLAAAPRTAALIQRGLAQIGEWLRRALPERTPAPPQTAMLARYPAPSAGYFPHVDNPGGDRDNGRALSAILYLNPSERACAGGELALWAAGQSTADAARALAPARGGSAVWLDARAAAHQVRPLAEGPPRWALTFWCNDRLPQPEAVALEAGSPTVTDLLTPIAAPPLPPGRVLFHELDGDDPRGTIAPRAIGDGAPSVGLVCTVYRGGLELDAFCAHHVGLGFDHLYLIFDHLEEPAEAADAQRLCRQYPSQRLSIWGGPEVAAERWPRLPALAELAALRRAAAGRGGSSAVSARQTLNASAALAAAKIGEGPGQSLDWLLHLDVDERFRLEGAGRGGASLRDHFAAAGEAGLDQARYANHELLAPLDSPPRYKLNPRLAAAKLGPRGWTALKTLLERDGRPYFHGYHNGKSAVRVSAGLAAAGVHGWRLVEPDSAARSRFLAGPVVLHRHFIEPAAFRAKYLAMADEPPRERLFPPAPIEEAALALIARLRARGADEAELAAALDALRRRMTELVPAEIALLEEAALLAAE